MEKDEIDMIYIKDRLLKSMGNIELIGLNYNEELQEISFCIYLKNSEDELFHRDIHVKPKLPNNYDSGSCCGVMIENSLNRILSKMKRKIIKEIK